MNNTTVILRTILLAAITLSSCGNSASETDIPQVDVHSTNVNESVDSGNVKAAEISCSIFFQTDDREIEETGEMIKGEVLEREEFRISKSYTWCYDVEGFHHLTISGEGKNLSLAVNAGRKTILKKDKFDLNGNLTLTSKEVNFLESEKYSIVIKQEENMIFEGKIDSQGCM